MTQRGVLEGAFTLLEALNAAGGAAGLTDLVRASGLPKRSLVDRLLSTARTFGTVLTA